MQHTAARAGTIAEENIASGLRFEHEGEILRTHGRAGVALEVRLAHDLAGCPGGLGGLGRAVDCGRIAPFIADLGACARGL